MSRDLLAIAVPARARRSVTLLHALCNHMPKPLMVCGVCLQAPRQRYHTRLDYGKMTGGGLRSVAWASAITLDSTSVIALVSLLNTLDKPTQTAGSAA